MTAGQHPLLRFEEPSHRPGSPIHCSTQIWTAMLACKFLTGWIWSQSCQTARLNRKSASTCLNRGCANWYKVLSTTHIYPLNHILEVDLAASKGLHIPHDIIPSSLPPVLQHTSHTESTNLMSVCFPMVVNHYPCFKTDLDHLHHRHTTQNAPSTSVFRSKSNDPRKTRKLDKIKEKLIDMLREPFRRTKQPSSN